MDAIRRASAGLFYSLGSCLIVLVILARRGLLSAGMERLLHVLDLPLIFAAFVYGGSSLYTSLAKGRRSLPLLLAVMVPLGVIFVVLAWFNFGMPLAEEL